MFINDGLHKRAFRVHVGGARQWRYFATLAAASAFCAQVFKATGIVLSITEGAK